jgi:hypothetical protein
MSDGKKGWRECSRRYIRVEGSSRSSFVCFLMDFMKRMCHDIINMYLMNAGFQTKPVPYVSDI